MLRAACTSLALLAVVAASPSSLRGQAEMAIRIAEQAALSEHGYLQVALFHHDEAMETYIHRVIASKNKVVTDLGELKGFAPWFSGTKATQSFLQLSKEVDAKPWIVEKMAVVAEKVAGTASNVASGMVNEISDLFHRKEGQKTVLHEDVYVPEKGLFQNASAPLKIMPSAEFPTSQTLDVDSGAAAARQAEEEHVQNRIASSKILPTEEPVALDVDSGASPSSITAHTAEKEPRPSCQDSCYSGIHEDKQWANGKCKWINCQICKECRVDSQRHPNEQAHNTCKESCHSSAHPDFDWVGAPAWGTTRRSSALSDSEWVGGKCMWEACAGCTECAKAVSNAPGLKRKKKVTGVRIHLHAFQK